MECCVVLRSWIHIVCNNYSNFALSNFCKRYLAEFKTGVERKESADSTMVAYKAAQVGPCCHFHNLLLVSDCYFFYGSRYIVPSFLSDHCFSLADYWTDIFSLCLVLQLYRILHWLNWLLPIPSGLDSHLTSQCSIMRFWTLQTKLATLRSR